MARNYTTKNQYTKEQIKAVLDLWADKTTDQIAQQLGLGNSNITYLANQIRKAGGKLPKKHIRGKLRSLIHEVMAERVR